ncbi:hypothetical protein H6504_03440 [Candidatus Woesearchaeota archaeon]|nr:hypothetical protein [Candidatus Woesearchaeota archaeon]
MRLWVLLGLALLWCSVAVSATQTSYWMFEGDAFPFEDTKIILMDGEYQQRVYVKVYGELFSLGNDTCERDGPLEVCHKTSALDGYDTVNDKERYKFQIIVTSHRGVLGLAKSITKSVLFPEEDAVVTFTFSNSGDYLAEDILYEEDFSPFNLKSATGCKIVDKTIRVSIPSLPEDDEKVCIFTINSFVPAKINSDEFATYFDGVKYMEARASHMPIEVKSGEVSVTITPDGKRSSIPVEDTINVQFLLQNQHLNDSANLANMLLNFDSSSLEMMNAPRWWERVSPGQYRFTGTLPKDSSNMSSIDFKMLRSGRHNVSFSGTYRIGAFTRQSSTFAIVQGSIDKATLPTQDAFKKDLDGNVKLSVVLDNPSSKYDYRDVSIRVVVPALDIDYTEKFPTLPLKGFDELVYTDFPDNISDGTYDVSVYATYLSQYGEKLYAHKNLTFKYISDSGAPVLAPNRVQPTQEVDIASSNIPSAPIQTTAKKGGVSNDAILGVAVGTVVFVILLIVLVLYLRMRKKERESFTFKERLSK